MIFDGQTYWGHGGQVRIPRPGPVVGQGKMASCGEGTSSTFDVARFPGVEPQRVVLALGGVWLGDAYRSEPLPAEVVALEASVPCTRADVLVGDWISYVGPDVDSDGALKRPYVAVFQANEGSSLPLERYASVSVRVHVTSGTAGADDEELATKSLRGPSLVRASVHCEGDRFVADRLELSD